MVSVGDRSHITDITFPRFKNWCIKNGYEYRLLKDNLLLHFDYDRPLHFNKCLIHKYFKGFDEYLVIDDDILIGKNTPKLPLCNNNEFFIAKDTKQDVTTAPYVNFNANSGFMLGTKLSMTFLDRVFNLNFSNGVYITTEGYRIWGPYDQGPINEVIFKHTNVQELDTRFNYAFVTDFWTNGDSSKWLNSKYFRFLFYFSLALPFHPNFRRMRNAYSLHLIHCPYFRYIDIIFNVLNIKI